MKNEKKVQTANAASSAPVAWAITRRNGEIAWYTNGCILYPSQNLADAAAKLSIGSGESLPLYKLPKLAQPVQPADHIADVSKLVSEFVIADLAMTHLGSYAEKDYDFAMAVLRTYQIAQPVQPDLDALVAAARKVMGEFGTPSDGLKDLYQTLKAYAAPEPIAQPVQPANLVPLTRLQVQTIVINVCDQIYPQDDASDLEADTVFYGAFVRAIEAAHGIAPK